MFGSLPEPTDNGQRTTDKPTVCQPNFKPNRWRIANVLAGLRLRIRSYVWTEGLAAAVVVLGVAFWFSLAFDWLFEPPWQFRAVMLVLVAAAVVCVVNRFILRRAFRPLDDANLAMLLERRFRDYRDSLLTTVELGSHPRTCRRIQSRNAGANSPRSCPAIRKCSPGRRVPFRPTDSHSVAAAALSIAVLLFALLAREAFGTWVNRVVLLDKNLLWPRTNHVRVDDFPDNHIRKVAKGTDFEIHRLRPISAAASVCPMPCRFAFTPKKAPAAATT